jgi:hypothetical protein
VDESLIQANRRVVALRVKMLLLTKDVEIERERSKRWQKLAGRYDDIRDWLRICEDDENGWAEFYRQVCLLVFGQYRDEDAEVNDIPLGEVGFRIRIPSELDSMRMVATDEVATEAWIKNLEIYAKRFCDSARVVAQPPTPDPFGAPDQYWVIVWTDVAGEDIESGRQFLEAEDYHVSSISLHYDAATA